MAPSQYTNKRVLISQIPEGVSPSTSHFRTVSLVQDKPELKDGEVFIKNLTFSLDPYIRYDFPKGVSESPVVGHAIAEVLESKNARFPVGSHVFSSAAWEQYTHVHEPEFINDLMLLPEAPAKVPIAAFNGILGIPGYTAWDALRANGDLKAGETIYVSSAAGTLGQLVGQLAKRKGLRVIGSAGSQAKLDFLKNELGYDEVFNYKTEDKRAALTRLVGEKGLDIFFDVVFDDTVEVALDLLNPHGRILFVGLLSGHQNQAPPAPKNLINILFKQLKYVGYLVFERYENLDQFWEEVTPLVASGAIQYRDNTLEGGVESLAGYYVKMLNGEYTGKVSVNLV
ncbi:hypothetical protein DFQ27_008100 [Actinomortierella ambigua]|uniref:Enoyl reductase (ER) domain-containing protein n=1 Tax=Actinomortierella ambigua TaxID=1343610 RepID=A0A9P6TZ89_9FUNG|nr:hypothetical protein DFQ27_008100 [Actinomortierella ambigua]